MTALRSISRIRCECWKTGNCFGSPLNDIGVDTLGGQAVLDGFAVAFFPIRYINGVGAAFALFLCMMLGSQARNILPC